MKVQYLNLALDGTQAHQEDASETGGWCGVLVLFGLVWWRGFLFCFSFFYFYFFLRNHSLVCLRLRWVFATVHRLSLVVAAVGADL